MESGPGDSCEKILDSAAESDNSENGPNCSDHDVGFKNELLPHVSADVHAVEDFSSGWHSSSDDSDDEEDTFYSTCAQYLDQRTRTPGQTNLSTGDILVVVHAYVCRYNLSNIAGSGLLQLIRALFPEAKNSIPSTWHRLQEKLFGTLIRTTECKVCSTCKTVVEKGECRSCHKQVMSQYTIVQVSVEDQLQLYFKGTV